MLIYNQVTRLEQYKHVPTIWTTQVVAHALALCRNHVVTELKVMMSHSPAMMASSAHFGGASTGKHKAVTVPSTGGCLLYES